MIAARWGQLARELAQDEVGRAVPASRLCSGTTTMGITDMAEARLDFWRRNGILSSAFVDEKKREFRKCLSTRV